MPRRHSTRSARGRQDPLRRSSNPVPNRSVKDLIAEINARDSSQTPHDPERNHLKTSTRPVADRYRIRPERAPQDTYYPKLQKRRRPTRRQTEPTSELKKMPARLPSRIPQPAVTATRRHESHAAAPTSSGTSPSEVVGKHLLFPAEFGSQWGYGRRQTRTFAPPAGRRTSRPHERHGNATTNPLKVPLTQKPRQSSTIPTRRATDSHRSNEIYQRKKNRPIVRRECGHSERMAVIPLPIDKYEVVTVGMKPRRQVLIGPEVSISIDVNEYETPAYKLQRRPTEMVPGICKHCNERPPKQQRFKTVPQDRITADSSTPEDESSTDLNEEIPFVEPIQDYTSDPSESDSSLQDEVIDEAARVVEAILSPRPESFQPDISESEPMSDEGEVVASPQDTFEQPTSQRATQNFEQHGPAPAISREASFPSTLGDEIERREARRKSSLSTNRRGTEPSNPVTYTDLASRSPIRGSTSHTKTSPTGVTRSVTRRGTTKDATDPMMTQTEHPIDNSSIAREVTFQLNKREPTALEEDTPSPDLETRSTEQLPPLPPVDIQDFAESTDVSEADSQPGTEIPAAESRRAITLKTQPSLRRSSRAKTASTFPPSSSRAQSEKPSERYAQPVIPDEIDERQPSMLPSSSNTSSPQSAKDIVEELPLGLEDSNNWVGLPPSLRKRAETQIQESLGKSVGGSRVSTRKDSAPILDTVSTNPPESKYERQLDKTPTTEDTVSKYGKDGLFSINTGQVEESNSEPPHEPVFSSCQNSKSYSLPLRSASDRKASTVPREDSPMSSESSPSTASMPPLPPPNQVLNLINDIMKDHKAMLRSVTQDLKEGIAQIDSTRELTMLLHDAARLAPSEHFADSLPDDYVSKVKAPPLLQRWTTLSPESEFDGTETSSNSSPHDLEDSLVLQRRRSSQQSLEPKDTIEGYFHPQRSIDSTSEDRSLEKKISRLPSQSSTMPPRRRSTQIQIPSSRRPSRKSLSGATVPSSQSMPPTRKSTALLPTSSRPTTSLPWTSTLSSEISARPRRSTTVRSSRSLVSVHAPEQTRSQTPSPNIQLSSPDPIEKSSSYSLEPAQASKSMKPVAEDNAVKSRRRSTFRRRTEPAEPEDFRRAKADSYRPGESTEPLSRRPTDIPAKIGTGLQAQPTYKADSRRPITTDKKSGYSYGKERRDRERRGSDDAERLRREQETAKRRGHWWNQFGSGYQSKRARPEPETNVHQQPDMVPKSDRWFRGDDMPSMPSMPGTSGAAQRRARPR